MIKITTFGQFDKAYSSYLSHRKFRVSVEGELSKPTEIEAGCLKVPSWPLQYK